MSVLYPIIYAISGSNPFLFHLTSVLFHIATAVLILYLMRRFFSDKIAFILSLIFLVHPAAVEAVCFASSLQEILFTFTGLLALYSLARQKNISTSHIIVAISLSTLALLMKETGIVFFPLIFFYLFIFHRKNSSALVLFGAFSTVILFTYVFGRWGGAGSGMEAGGLFPIMRVPFTTRMMNIPMIILYYIRTFLFPFNLGIAQHWVVRSINTKEFWMPLCVDIFFVCTAFIYMLNRENYRLDSRLRGNDNRISSEQAQRRSGIFLFFFLWFLIGLLPHLQIIAINMTVAERWLYFPMIGMLGMIGAIVESIKFKAESLKLKVILICIVSLFFVRSFARTLDWRNGLALYGSTISPTSSFDMQNNMGVELFRVGKYDEAKKYFEKSVKLAPYWWVNWNNLGAAYEREQNYAKAQEYYEKSVKNGDYQLAYENLAKILVMQGADKQNAKAFLQKALEKFPNDEVLKALQEYKK